MGRKVCHVEEEKTNLLEEVAGEKNTHAVKGGENKKPVCVTDAHLVAQAHILLSYCVPESTQCHRQLLKDTFASTDPVVPALRLLK